MLQTKNQMASRFIIAAAALRGVTGNELPDYKVLGFKNRRTYASWIQRMNCMARELESAAYELRTVESDAQAKQKS